jgi:hypothetical protein
MLYFYIISNYQEQNKYLQFMIAKNIYYKSKLQLIIYKKRVHVVDITSHVISKQPK